MADFDISKFEQYAEKPTAAGAPPSAEEPFDINKFAAFAEEPTVDGEIPAPIEPAAPAAVAPGVAASDDSSMLSAAGDALWDYSPARAAYEFARKGITGQAPESSLGKAATGYAEGLVQGAALGTKTPLNYVKAAGDYVRDAIDPGTEADFSKSLEQAKADTTQVQADSPIASKLGNVAGTVGFGLATGGASGLAAKAAPQTAAALTRFVGTSLAKKATVAAGVLLAEGAVEGGLFKAAQELDKSADSGDWKSVGERLYAAVPAAALDGAKTNFLFGGGMKLGVLGVGKVIKGVQKIRRGGLPEVLDTPDNATAAYNGVAKQTSDRVQEMGEELDNLETKLAGMTDPEEITATQAQISQMETEQSQLVQVVQKARAEATQGGKLSQLAVKTSNKGTPPPPDTIEAAIHDPQRPLRSRDLEDAGDDVARAARANIDPETAAAVRLDALEKIESKGQRLLELQAKVNHQLRLATKNVWTRDLTEPWRGPSFDEMINQVGLSDNMLADLEKRTVGEGGSQVARLRDKIELVRSELPQAPAARPAKLQAPKPGQRLQTAQPALGENAAQNLGTLSDFRKSLERAATPDAPQNVQTLTLGHMSDALDAVKRYSQRLAAKKGGLIHERLLNPTEALRLQLEDVGTFSKFAEQQARVNPAWKYDIDTSSSPLAQRFFTESPVDARTLGADPYEDIEMFDRKVMQGFLENVGMPKGIEDQTEEALKRRLRASELSLGERLTWAKDDAGLVKDHHEISVLRKEIEDEINRVALANRAVSAKQAKPGLLEAAAQTGLTGATAKAVASRGLAWHAEKVADNAGAAFGLRAQAAKVQERLNQAAKKIDTRKMLEPVVERVQQATRRATVQSVIDSAEKLQDPESEDAQKMQSSLQKLEQTLGPDMAAAYAEQAQQRAAFLLDKAGPKPAPSPFGGQPARVLDEDTEERMANYIDAADNPLDALERIGAGLGTSEDHETLAALKPSMLADYKSKVVAQLAESKEEIPYEEQLAVSQALRLPLTPEEQPDTQAFWQAFSKQQMAGAQEAAMQRKPPKMNGSGAQSKADRVS